ncbi:hypothetical protein [Roseospira visakhapatnamensis]|uniref:Uncharacterized protein n=1 Tax=Roseospira visakhapatnamensis TaxID=390880 RepID=A0A7W6RAY2_9PROT|nr:hypothetical protein [Roseospira visakhapatnamensis]MBB4264796.1 hypothetical protein [Roseospira visakhapatnamensis]
MPLAERLARRRAERDREETEALAAELKARADRAFAVLTHIATHGHDDGSEPCVSPDPAP